MSLGIALKAFFAALGNRDKAEKISRLLSGQDLEGGQGTVKAIAAPAEKPATLPATATAPPTRPSRDSAITLLATLQRESRLVDLIHEDLGKYSDAQVGAAARPCLQQCAKVLQRVMGIVPLLDAAEGDSVPLPGDAAPTRYQWVGEGNSASGKLIHHGWQASKVDLPIWTGDQRDALIVAAAQLQAS